MRKPFSASASRNGSVSQAEDAERLQGQNEVASLQKEVSELRHVVAAQGKLVRDQV